VSTGAEQPGERHHNARREQSSCVVSPSVIVDAGPCPAQESPRLLVPAGVYRALADELRQQGYSSAQIKAETGDALVTPATDSRAASANCDRSR
jgi:hypothetical protein